VPRRSFLAMYRELNSDQQKPRIQWWVALSFVVILVGVVALSIFIDDTYIDPCPGARSEPSLKRPKATPPSTVIAWITPAYPITSYYPNITQYQEHVDGLVDSIGQNLSSMYTQFAFGPQFGYFSANDSDRASDVMAAFQDKSVAFIIANRGGWGCNRIIDMLDYGIIKANPKPIMGYSDLTGLLNAIHMRTGLVTFHGPMGLDDWPDNVNQQYIQQVIMGGEEVTFVNLPNFTTTTIVPGKAKGRLVGGNLSVFVAMLDSIFAPEDFSGKILFLEDVQEEPYSIDRMLTSLHLQGALNQISGFVFGQCSECYPPNNQSFTWQQVVEMRFSPLTNVPSYLGAMFGHEIETQFILPIGAMVEMDSVAGTITMLEAAVA